MLFLLHAGIVKSVNDAAEMTDSINYQSVQQQHREIGGLLSLGLHMKENMSQIVVEYPVCCSNLTNCLTSVLQYT